MKLVDAKKLMAENKHVIVISGFVVSLLFMLEVLPKTTELLSLGADVKYVYLVLIGVSAVVFYNNYFSRASNIKKSFQLERTTPTRNLSDPKHTRSLERQRAPPNPAISGRPSKDFLEQFDKD